MTARSGSGHPDLDSLAEYLGGDLAPGDARRIEAHIASCARCRMELARLGRFLSIDEDAELLEEAGWPEAERVLAEAFAERILPVAAGRRESRFARLAGFLAPVAAAAAVLLLFAVIESPRVPSGGDAARGPMRGIDAEAVELLSPAGDVEEAPASFEWRPSAGADRYALHVFDPSLETVFHLDDVSGTVVAVPDTVIARFVPGEIYLWRVDAFAGLEQSASSTNGWFRIRASSTTEP